MIKKILCCAVLFSLFLQHVAAMQTGWNKKESRHFIVYYRNAEKSFVKKVIKESEKNYRDIVKSLSLGSSGQWTHDDRAKIYIFDDRQQFHSNTSQPEWSDGSSIQRFKTIFSFLGAKKFFDTVLPHEIAHIVFREYVGFGNRNVPAWLEEGLASYHERIDRSRADEIFKDPRERDSFIRFQELSKIRSRSLRDDPDVDIFFAQSLSIVNFLLTEFGKKRFRIFCRGLKEGMDMDKSLAAAYSFKEISELEEAWQAYLKRK
jgi:hypothetical protein